MTNSTFLTAMQFRAIGNAVNVVSGVHIAIEGNEATYSDAVVRFNDIDSGDQIAHFKVDGVPILIPMTNSTFLTAMQFRAIGNAVNVVSGVHIAIEGNEATYSDAVVRFNDIDSGDQIAHFKVDFQGTVTELTH